MDTSRTQFPQESKYYHQQWFAEAFDKERFSSSFGRFLYSQEIELFVSLIDCSSGKVLDVGSGTGKLSLPLLSRSTAVTSADFSLEMLKVARNKAGLEGLVLQPVISDAQHLCFKDNAFEYVISSRMLMHLGDWRQGLSELCRVAESVVVIDFPPLISFTGFDSVYKRFKSIFSARVKSYRALLVKSVIQELRKHHFHVIVLRRQFFLPIAFHRWLNRPYFSICIEKLCRWLGLVWLMGAPVTLKAVKRRNEA